MKQRISNDFKERLLKGEITSNFDVNLYAVNSHFKDVYDTEKIAFEQFRRMNEFNIYSHNNFRNDEDYASKCLSACMFDYYTMPVTYSAYYNNDVADKPLFVNEENWDNFAATYQSIEGENLDRIKKYIDKNSRDFDKRNGGFYYVEEKSQMKWLANRINNEYDFNNALVIVLGDDLGGVGDETAEDLTPFYTELDFCISPVANKPFNGIFDLNGHTIQMFNVICSDYSNGVIGYLGENGIVCNGRVGNLTFINQKKISLETIKTENTDIFVGGLVGTNYGKVENIETFGRIEFRGFMPEVYLVQNKEEYQENASTIIDSKLNVFWPDRYCLNSPYNVIPYVGYFCEGSDSYLNSDLLEDQAAKTEDKTKNTEYLAFHEIKRAVHNFYDTKNCDTVDTEEDKTLFQLDDDFNENQGSKYTAAWGILSNNSIPVAQNLDEDEYTQKLKEQYNSQSKSELSNTANNFVQALLVSHAAENALNGDHSGSENHRMFFHKRMNRNGRNAYYCSPIVGTNFGTISRVDANAVISESQDTFVGFIGLITGKHNKGVISDVIAHLSINENSAHKDTKRIYNNGQQFDGEGKNRAFGYYYHRDMNNNDKHTDNTYRVPLYSLCYLDANAKPLGPNWTSACPYNYFSQMGSGDYSYCNWLVREGTSEYTEIDENTVSAKNNAIASAYSDNDVISSATSAALKLHFGFNETDYSSDFKVNVLCSANLDDTFKPALRIFDTDNIDDYSGSSVKNSFKEHENEYTWSAMVSAVSTDDLNIPNTKFNSYEEIELNDCSGFDFDVIEFKLEYLTNNWCDQSKYYTTDSAYSAYSAFAEVTLTSAEDYSAFSAFSAYSASSGNINDDGSYSFYIVTSADDVTCKQLAADVEQNLMLQGIALGAQCPYQIDRDDSKYTSATKAMWDTPEKLNTVSAGFLGINTNSACKHDEYARNPEVNEVKKNSVKSSMATIIVDNSSLPDGFTDIIKSEVNDNSIVRVEKIFVPLWNYSTNSRRSADLDTEGKYKRNFISFNYTNKDEKDPVNSHNVSYSYIHFSILTPEEVYDVTSGNTINNFNRCKVKRGILEIPTAVFDVPICITHTKDTVKEIENVTYEERENVFTNYWEYFRKKTAGEGGEPTPTFGKLTINRYASDLAEEDEDKKVLKTPNWQKECPTRDIKVLIEMAPYSMDEIASSEELQYEMPSIYNIGGIAGMYAPSFVGPDYSQGNTNLGASYRHAIQNCSIIVEPETKEFVERSLYASIKGTNKNAVIKTYDKEKQYSTINNDLFIANKFAGVAPIVEICPSDMGVIPGAPLSFTEQYETSFEYLPHAKAMAMLGRFSNSLINVNVFVKPFNTRANGKYISTSNINNQFYSNFFNWCNHSMMLDGTINAHQLTTKFNNKNLERGFIYGVSWDQPNALAPVLGRNYLSPENNDTFISDNDTYYSFAEYAANEAFPDVSKKWYESASVERKVVGGTMAKWGKSYAVNPAKLFGDWIDPISGYGSTLGPILKRNGSWSNRVSRACFMRHYETATQMLNFANCFSYEPVFDNGKVKVEPKTNINDIYMNPMMNSCSDSTDLYQPMYSESPHFCNMKLARPVMVGITENTISDGITNPLGIPNEMTYDAYSSLFSSSFKTTNFEGYDRHGETKDGVFTYDYFIGTPVKHELNKPAITANIHYSGRKFLYEQYEDDVFMPITNNGLYNDGSIVHLGLVPTASALPSLIGDAENGTYTGSVAVSGNDLAGFVITDTSDDQNIIGMLDLEREINLNSGAFVYQFNSVVNENEKNFGTMIEVK